LADFTADIPKRPADAPGDTYPAAGWEKYFKRVIDNLKAPYDHFSYPDSCHPLNVKIATEEVTLVISGSEPGPWEEGTKTETTILGVKVDYTTWMRHYDSLTFQKFSKVTLTFSLHFVTMPSDSFSDQNFVDVWYTPTGNPWTDRDYLEEREKLSSWGAGIVISVGGELGHVEIGGHLDFGHNGEDKRPPSKHPTPRYKKLRRDENPDESLKSELPDSAFKMRLGEIYQPSDRQPLTAEELAAALVLTPEAFSTLTIEDFAHAIKAGKYPGLVRFLIQRGAPSDTPSMDAHVVALEKKSAG